MGGRYDAVQKPGEAEIICLFFPGGGRVPNPEADASIVDM